MMPKTLIFLISTIILLTGNLKALKLDINMDNYFSIKSLNNLKYGSRNYNLSYYNQNSYLSFTLKNIVLEKADTFMDVSIGIRFMSINSSTKTLTSPYITDIYTYYDSKNMVFYPDKSYLKIYNFPKNKTSLMIGRFPFTLSSGMVIDDNQKGFNGIKIDLDDGLYTDNLNLFYFQPEEYKSPKTTHHLFGMNVKRSFGDGNWQIYYVNDRANGEGENINYYFKETNKKFYGTSYYIDKENMSYMLDVVFEGGKSINISEQKIKHESYAYNIKTGWKMNIPVIGKTKARFNFIKSSGNNSNISNKDKSFFSSFAKRYNAFERYGLGEIYKASIYDTSKTTDSFTGFNSKLSGLRVSNLGFDIDYKKGKFLVDYFNYKATQSINLSLSKFLGYEYNIKYILEMSKNLNLSITYGVLKLKTETPTKLFSITVFSSF